MLKTLLTNINPSDIQLNFLEDVWIFYFPTFYFNCENKSITYWEDIFLPLPFTFWKYLNKIKLKKVYLVNFCVNLADY